MKQIVQNYKTGDLWLEDVPVPLCRKGGVLVRTEYSVVSSGTERMKVDQARMSLIQKAKARPDQVRKVIQSMHQVGIGETLKKVQERLDSLTPLGYSSAGRIVEVGDGIDNLKIGDRVVCAGEGIACHAEYNFVPKNLCALVPDNVLPQDAAFSTIGAIALNGIRQAEVSLGDTVVVIGLGLVGLLAVQLLKAAGCRVIGVDVSPDKVELSRTIGADAAFERSDGSLLESISHLTDGRGADSVYIAASSRSSDPLDLAGEIARDRARIVIVGMVPVKADWQTYYAKELSVVMSRSYGPGRYDRTYEAKGIDYPVGYIPWSLRRNLAEFLRLISTKSIDLSLLGAKEFEFSNAPEAYSALHKSPSKHSVGIIFRYQKAADGEEVTSRVVRTKLRKTTSGSISIGLVGAGNFATGTLIPALKSTKDVRFRGICSAGGLSAKSAANRHGFEYATSDFDELLDDDTIDAVFIATRHDTHADFSVKALQVNKHVFVEKPIGLSSAELSAVRNAHEGSTAILMPGFNRRFSPLAEETKSFFQTSAGPVEIVCRVNAGSIGAESWYQDSEEGGWRIVSEGCHFVDLMSYLCGSLPVRVSAAMIGGCIDGGQNDNCIATIQFENGSIGVLAYVSNGDPHFEKERVEVFGQRKVAVIENWQRVVLSANGKKRSVKARGSGKGHAAEIRKFIGAIADGGPSPISIESALRVSQAMIGIQDSLKTSGSAVDVR